jgi:hypothetical protein
MPRSDCWGSKASHSRRERSTLRSSCGPDRLVRQPDQPGLLRTQPIDLIKVRLQVGARPFNERQRSYRDTPQVGKLEQAVQIIAELTRRLDKIAIHPISSDSNQLMDVPAK